MIETKLILHLILHDMVSGLGELHVLAQNLQIIKKKTYHTNKSDTNKSAESRGRKT